MDMAAVGGIWCVLIGLGSFELVFVGIEPGVGWAGTAVSITLNAFLRYGFPDNVLQ